MQKDKSWTAPDTTAFKNIQPGDIPESTYEYRGEKVGEKGNLPDSNYSYKGDSVGKKGDLPDKTSDEVANYKGCKECGKKSAYKGSSQV